MDVLVVGIDLRGVLDEARCLVAGAAEGVGHVVHAGVELIGGILGLLHGVEAGGGRELVRGSVEGVCGVLGGRQQAGVDALEALCGLPLGALVVGALELDGGLQRVLVLGHEAVHQVVRVVVHRWQDGQGKQQQQRREAYAHEQRGEVAQVAQEDANAEAGGKAQALRQPEPALGARLTARLVPEELQRGLSHLAEQAEERDEDEEGGGRHGALQEDAPVPAHLEGGQAVGAVVEVLHRGREESDAKHAAQG